VLLYAETIASVMNDRYHFSFRSEEGVKALDMDTLTEITSNEMFSQQTKQIKSQRNSGTHFRGLDGEIDPNAKPIDFPT